MTNSKTIRSQVGQPAPAGKGADMSELQAHQCMTPEQWSWLRCSVSVIPAKNVIGRIKSIIIGIELLTWNFLENFGS